MRKALLDLLACPACETPLAPTAPSLAPDEDLREGELPCPCGEIYPILDGVPSMIPSGGNGKGKGIGEGRSGIDPRTPESFGLQWRTYDYGDATWFKELELRVREIPAILDVEPAALDGERLLDAGCGHGALTAAATRLGCETVGLDMSSAIFGAEKRRAELPESEASRVHYVHGNILKPPFAPATFPFIMSIGVLHHTPAPELGLAELVRRLDAGGRIYVQLYRTREPWIGLPNAAIRAFTSRLPPSWTMGLCRLVLPVHTAAVQGVARLRGERSPIGEFSSRERLVSLFDNFSPRYQYRYTSEQVLAMFANARLDDAREVTLENERRHSVGVVGRVGRVGQGPGNE